MKTVKICSWICLRTIFLKKQFILNLITQIVIVDKKNKGAAKSTTLIFSVHHPRSFHNHYLIQIT